MIIPFELYIAILIACSCVLLLTVTFVVAAVYFKARILAMENLVTRLEGGLAGLIDESQGFVSILQQVARRGDGMMQHVDRMTHTARSWSDRANRTAHAFMASTAPSLQFVKKIIRSNREAFNTIKHATRQPNKTSSLTRSIEMSENNNGSKTPQIMMAIGIGAVIGAGVTMLFAPRSGKETREMVANKTSDLKDTAVDVLERGKHIVDEVKHEAYEAYEKGKKAAHEVAAA